MLINFVCVGSKMPAWVNQGYEEYAKRLNKDIRIKLIEVVASKRAKTISVEKLKAEEAGRILKVIPKGAYVVALDVKGKQWSTEDLSVQLERWLHLGQDVNLIVGGPDGLDAEILKLANEKWSLSNLTFPHPIVRVVVSEQIYRAWSLLNNHPYHRA
jgi:23S rRNA (pseudouridine1915-N3)-methyltransferase